MQCLGALKFVDLPSYLGNKNAEKKAQLCINSITPICPGLTRDCHLCQRCFQQQGTTHCYHPNWFGWWISWISWIFAMDFNIFRDMSTYFNLFQAISTYFNLVQPISTYFDLFQPSKHIFSPWIFTMFHLGPPAEPVDAPGHWDHVALRGAGSADICRQLVSGYSNHNS